MYYNVLLTHKCHNYLSEYDMNLCNVNKTPDQMKWCPLHHLPMNILLT